MKKQLRNRQGKHGLSLPMMSKARREASKFKCLYIEQSINVQIEKRRTKLERMDCYLFATLLEWISDYILLQDWKDEKLMAKIEEYRAFRQRKVDSPSKNARNSGNLKLMFMADTWFLMWTDQKGGAAV